MKKPLKTNKMNYYVFPGLKRTIDPSSGPLCKRGKISTEEVIKIVAKSCNVTVDDIRSNMRRENIVEARHITCGVLRNEFDYSLKFIGDVMGGKHHTTIIHSIRTFRDRYKVYNDYKQLVDGVTNEIKVYIACN